MTKRKIIKIDEGKCNGCGLCIPSCAEGALQIVDGKAKLVKEIYCDGLGTCLGHCPEGAITIEEREAQAFSEEATKRHLEEIKKELHRYKEELACGCPGSTVQTIERGVSTQHKHQIDGKSDSWLLNWPVQLMLVPAEAPFFKDVDLLIAADCVPFSYPDFHQDFLRGKTLVVGCPKLDASTIYEEKLAEIFKENNIRSITVLHMEVPCCFGLRQIVDEALRMSGKDIPIKDITIGIRGDIKEGK